MAIYRGEYATVYIIRSLYVKANETADDVLLLREIRGTSRQIDAICAKAFWPRYGSVDLDIPCDRQLDFGEWFSDVSAVENGNGETIASTEYNLIPSKPPYYALKLRETTGTIWELDGNGDSEGAITVTGTICFAREHISGWESTGATLAAAISSTSATTFTCTTGLIKAGMLLKIAGSDEILYASSVTTGASDTVTVERGQNGSTATTHSNGAALTYWTPGADIEELCARAAYGYYKAKNNPVGEAITLDGATFNTPKDIAAYLENELRRIGLLALV